jgi:hypothetical protein
MVQEILDHAQISVTPDTYFHVLPGMQEKAVETMSDLLGECDCAGSNEDMRY